MVVEVEITDEESERLRELAQEQRVSVPDLIRDAIVQRLLARPEPTMAEKRRRAQEVIGKYHSGVSDLGRNHDKYLAEVFGE